MYDLRFLISYICEAVWSSGWSSGDDNCFRPKRVRIRALTTPLVMSHHLWKVFHSQFHHRSSVVMTGVWRCTAVASQWLDVHMVSEICAIVQQSALTPGQI